MRRDNNALTMAQGTTATWPCSCRAVGAAAAAAAAIDAAARWRARVVLE